MLSHRWIAVNHMDRLNATLGVMTLLFGLYIGIALWLARRKDIERAHARRRYRAHVLAAMARARGNLRCAKR